MGGPGNIVVGVLGQWASGKSTAAKTLVDHLGGEERVIFLTDRVLVGQQVARYLQALEEGQLERAVEAGGRRRLEGPLMTAWLDAGQTFDTVDMNYLDFALHDDVFDKVPAGECNLMDKARLELGRQIGQRVTEGKPLVVEAGFGTDCEPKGVNPFCQDLAALFGRLDETGLALEAVKWILIEASFETRRARNERRIDRVPAREFDRFAADGGDLEPDQQRALERQGLTIVRVANEHDNLERFKADIIAAYERLFAAG